MQPTERQKVIKWAVELANQEYNGDLGTVLSMIE